VRNQQEFNNILTKRYRRDALRIFLACHHLGFLVPTQGLAEKSCEYSNLEVLKIILNRKDQIIDVQALFMHSVSINLAEAVSILIKDQRVRPDVNDCQALKLAAMQDHLEVVKVLLTHPSMDPNKAIEFAASDEIEKMLKQDKRVTATMKKKRSIKTMKKQPLKKRKSIKK
jgi:hypothetical protein